MQKGKPVYLFKKTGYENKLNKIILGKILAKIDNNFCDKMHLGMAMDGQVRPPLKCCRPLEKHEIVLYLLQGVITSEQLNEG